MSRKKKVKLKTQLRTYQKCKLCFKESNCLAVNKFCPCITSESDYCHEKIIINGKASLRKVLVQENIPKLRSIYAQRMGIMPSSKPRKLSSEERKSRKEKNNFYQSWEWKQLRFKILTRFGSRCMLCGATNKDAKMCVDHILPISLHWDKRLDEDNLQVLCDECNKGKSNTSFDDFRPK